jgi:pimeloyl-ACP methyl ester carboxylesterase
MTVMKNARNNKTHQDYIVHGLGIPLSAQGRMPEAENHHRPLIIAIHGGTYSSNYFDIEGYSLLDRAQAQCLPIIAIDRPGYGHSTDFASAAPSIIHHAQILESAIDEIWRNYKHQACGVVLIGHSIGGAVCIGIAARQPSWPLLGIAVSGVGLDPVPESKDKWNQIPSTQTLVNIPMEAMNGFFFGPEATYDSNVMPQASYSAGAPAPRSELIDISFGWPKMVATLAANVTVPVHYRQPEFEKLWPVSEDLVSQFANAFSNSPEVDATLVLGAGHCIDFHRVGEQFQLEQLSFAKRCAERV